MTPRERKAFEAYFYHEEFGIKVCEYQDQLTQTDKTMLALGMSVYGDLKERLREEKEAESDHGSNINKNRATERAEALAQEDDHDYDWVQ